MKFNKRYEIDIVIVEILPDGNYGNIYNDISEFKRECPVSEYRFGYCVIDRKTGCVPDECNDWNDTVEEAIFDCEDNCAKNKTFMYIEVSRSESWCFIDIKKKHGLSNYNNEVNSDYIVKSKSNGKYYKLTDEFKTYDDLYYIYEFEEVNIEEIEV